MISSIDDFHPDFLAILIWRNVTKHNNFGNTMIKFDRILKNYFSPIVASIPPTDIPFSIGTSKAYTAVMLHYPSFAKVSAKLYRMPIANSGYSVLHFIATIHKYIPPSILIDQSTTLLNSER